MSYVTNIILTTDEPTDAWVSVVNSYFSSPDTNQEKPLVSVDDLSLPRGWYGGSKMLEARVFIGAFNYMNLPGFVVHLRTVQWKYPEAVKLMVKQQEDEEGFQCFPVMDDRWYAAWSISNPDR